MGDSFDGGVTHVVAHKCSAGDGAHEFSKGGHPRGGFVLVLL